MAAGTILGAPFTSGASPIPATGAAPAVGSATPGVSSAPGAFGGLPSDPMAQPNTNPAAPGTLNTGAGGYGNNPYQQMGDQFSASQASQTGSGTTTGNQAGTQANTYTAPQAGMQGNLGSLLMSIQNGGPSAGMGLPQDVWNTAMSQYDKGPAMQQAALYGAGSPQIASGKADLIANLAGQSGTMAWNNAFNLGNEEQTYGFTPTGSTQAQTNANQSNTNQSSNTTGEQFSNWLTNLLSFLH